MAGAGLQDVIASDSQICLLDGAKGRLVYRGYDVAELVEHCDFEEVAHLLWTGELPRAAELAELKRKLAAHRPLSGAMHHLLGDLPASAPPMSLLRTCVSAMGVTDPRAESSDPATNLEMAQELTAQIASIVASIHRLRRGHGPVQPEPGLSHAANFLYMLNGKRPDERTARIFDGCLILHAEHEFNASTFAARVIAATLSDIYSAITGAIGALRGPLHGGANQKVMLMLQEIGEPSKAADHVRRLLAAKQKVMGFGHRVYKTEDPRATFLRRWSQELGEKLGQPQWFQISQIIERVMLEEKKIHCNVDFYSASVYHMLGIPTDLFTPVFAASRTVGWTAHVLEQYANNRLIRPLANYTGPVDLKVKAIKDR